jgi:hypothetical protein
MVTCEGGSMILQIASTSKSRDAMRPVVEHETNHRPTNAPKTRPRDAHTLGMRTYSNNDPLTFDLFNGDDSYENPKLPEFNRQISEQDEDFDFVMNRNDLSVDSPAEQYELENYCLGLGD